jgi:hypothetical protein
VTGADALMIWQASRAAAPQAGLTDAEVAAAVAEMASAPQEFDIYLDEEASALLRDTIGEGEAAAVRIQFGNGHSGPGLYVSLAEYPKEGSIKLWDSPIAAAPQSVEPYGQVTTHKLSGQQFFYRWPNPPYLDNAFECVPVYLAPPTAPTDAEWQEEAMRLVSKLRTAVRDDSGAGASREAFNIAVAAEESLRAHIATRPLPAPPTKKENGV